MSAEEEMRQNCDDVQQKMYAREYARLTALLTELIAEMSELRELMKVECLDERERRLRLFRLRNIAQRADVIAEQSRVLKRFIV